MKQDGVYIYSIIPDDNNPLLSNYTFDLLFSSTNGKLEWLYLDKGVRFCIPMKKESGDYFNSIEDFLSNMPPSLDLKLDFKYRIIERKSNFNIGEYYRYIYRPVISYKLQGFHMVKDGVPFSDSFDDISIWNYRKEYLSHIRQLDYILDQLKEVFRVVEPSLDNKETYGNTLRNIIILSCTEIDSMMSNILKSNSFYVKDDKYNTKHYVKLKEALRLTEYTLTFNEYEDLGAFSPYFNWNKEMPSVTIPWYDVYNKVKHDRQANMHLANMDNALASIAAYAILVVAQYGKENYLWKDHMRKYFNFSKIPYWALEDFYVPHTHDLVPINYSF